MKRDTAQTDLQSGFGESRFTVQNTLFNDGNVWVSTEQFVNGTKHYPLARVTAVEVVRGSAVTLRSLAVFTVGLATLQLQLYVGLALIAGTVMFWIGRKPYFHLTLKVGSKITRAMTSTDHKHLSRVYDAIVEALEIGRATRS